MVNRNAGSGTRVLLDGLCAARGRRLRQSAALAQRGRRRDHGEPRRLGVAIEPVARMYAARLPRIAPERYDFLLIEHAATSPP